MLRKLTLENFRGFQKHSIEFRDRTFIVGRNNAGKSTVNQALRIISIVCQRAKFLRFVDVPDWIDLPVGTKGVVPSLRGMDIDLRSAGNRYSHEYSTISAEFGNKFMVSVYISPEHEKIFVTLRDGRIRIFSRSQLYPIDIPEIFVMPPVGSLLEREEVLNYSTVRANLSTNLASLNFRNQLSFSDLLYYDDGTEIEPDDDADGDYEGHDPHFVQFVELAESTWPHLQINGLENDENEKNVLRLFIRDGDFVAEIGMMGH
ncbi:MAG: hypothetical protein ACI9MJ_000778 [Alphaproteobacteria bacterium]|jgi:hypothetical protein